MEALQRSKATLHYWANPKSKSKPKPSAA
jgi:hypothetical protein